MLVLFSLHVLRTLCTLCTLCSLCCFGNWSSGLLRQHVNKPELLLLLLVVVVVVVVCRIAQSV